MPGSCDDSRRWDGAAARAGGYYLPPPLAELKVGEYSRLLSGWGIGRCRRALVTDLYESSFGVNGLGEALGSLSEEVVGLDISRVICRRAKRSLEGGGIRAKVISGDCRRIPLADECVDLILSPSTFDHFPEIGAALAECRRVLRPGGRLVLALNSADNPLYRLGVRLAERFKRREYPTDFFYTARQARCLLAEAGFRPGRAAAIMQVPVGLTTMAEVMAGLGASPGGLANRLLIGVCRSLGRAGGLGRLTGWWVAVEGIK
jgi:SAM-dependent methyltransferase